MKRKITAMITGILLCISVFAPQAFAADSPPSDDPALPSSAQDENVDNDENDGPAPAPAVPQDKGPAGSYKAGVDKYTVTVNGGSGDGTYAEGERVTIKADAAPEGKIFRSWLFDGAAPADPSAAETSFVMPAGNVTATASYESSVKALRTYAVRSVRSGDSFNGMDMDDTEPADYYETTLKDAKIAVFKRGGGNVTCIDQGRNGFLQMSGSRLYQARADEGWRFTGFQHRITNEIKDETTVNLSYSNPEQYAFSNNNLADTGDWTTPYDGMSEFIRLNRLITQGELVGYPLVYRAVGYFDPVVTVTWNEGGKVTGSNIQADGTRIVKYGKTANFVMRPSEGKYAKSLTLDGNPVPESSLTRNADGTVHFALTDVRAPHRINAEFADSPEYNVFVNGGTGSGTYKAGSLVTITANMAPYNHAFNGWDIEEGSPVLADADSSTTTFRMPFENVKVGASYKRSAADVTFKVENGTWADGTTDDIIVNVPFRGESGTLDESLVPEGMLPADRYEGGLWDRVPGSEAITGDITYTYSFDPCRYANITFKVENGTWADGTDADIVKEIKLTDGSAELTEDDIPEGILPADRYENGSWDRAPGSEVITGDITYTYSFDPCQYVNVTFKVENGTWADGTDADIVKEIKLTDGSAELTEDDIPEGMLPADRYENGSWDRVPGSETVTEDTAYTYSFDPCQYVNVTFKVENGTWADGTDADIVKEIKLTDGKATLDAAYIPEGMKPAEGYEGGAWNEKPDLSEGALTEDVTYTYAFAEKAVIPAAEDDTEGPKTGDGDMIPWMLLMAAALAGTIITVRKRSER